jgi:energy-coupling factor transporter ATP-binding protein EcfA2
MIHSVRIRDLRGVRQGELSGIPKLAVLVGRNGAGKSTLLEAMAIGGAHQPPAVVGLVVQARGGWNGAAYLIRGQAEEAEVVVELDGGEARATTLRFYPEVAVTGPAELPPELPPNGSLSAIQLRVDRRAAAAGPEAAGGVLVQQPVGGGVRFAVNNSFAADRMSGLGPGELVRLLYPAAARANPLWRNLNDVVRAGRDAAVVELLRGVLGSELRDLYFMPEAEDARVGNVHLRYTWGSVPVDVAGDGVRALVRLALELAGRSAATVLLEEPEVHLHPGALRAVARAVWTACAAGTQVVLATHSLELLDTLVEQAPEGHLDDLGVIRSALVAGALRTHHIAGTDVRDLRLDLAEDLR